MSQWKAAGKQAKARRRSNTLRYLPVTVDRTAVGWHTGESQKMSAEGESRSLCESLRQKDSAYLFLWYSDRCCLML